MEFTLPRLSAAHTRPLYQQLYAHFVAEIRAGRLLAGEKVPSKRRLAQELHISVNTVDTAYQMLVAEGYLEARARSGFHVCALERLQLPPRGSAASNAAAGVSSAPNFAAADMSRAAGAAFGTGEKPDLDSPSVRYRLGTAAIDTSLFPFKTWRRLQRDILAGNPALLNHGPRQGDENLRAAIARYLHEFRGAECTAAQIVVGAGIEYLLGLLARLFCNAVFAVEDPGYPRTARVLQNSGASVVSVPVDSAGLSVTALAVSGAQLAYVTPSHQFPTGAIMPVGRRTALLRWAGEAPARYVIEDDYDSEFRFDGKPLPSLQGLDDHGRVIYISTFSRSIAPAIRIGYMVLPPDVLARYHAMFGFYSSTVSRFEQQTLCAFLEGGYFARHLARTRLAYRQRRDALVSALSAAFGTSLTVSGAHTGLHLLVQKQNGHGELALVHAALREGVELSGLSAYYREHAALCPPNTAVLGYAGLAPEDVTGAVDALRRAWHA